jgi:hypothetical protein
MLSMIRTLASLRLPNHRQPSVATVNDLASGESCICPSLTSWSETSNPVRSRKLACSGRGNPGLRSTGNKRHSRPAGSAGAPRQAAFQGLRAQPTKAVWRNKRGAGMAHDDLIKRAEARIRQLYDRSLAMSHPGEDGTDILVLQTLAMLLELQNHLAREVARIHAQLDASALPAE